VFVPRPKPFDGTLTGNSYLSLWLRCRRKWFAKYVWPHPDGSTGLEVPKASIRLGKRGLEGPGANLMLGSMLHTFKEGWYRSGIAAGEDTGERSVDAATAALDMYCTKRRPEFANDEAANWALAEVARWGSDFHRFYGPGGHTPLFPQERILCLEDGTPAIELEFSVPLGYRDFAYTCRMDALALWQDMYLIGLETKTAAPSWVDRYVNQLPKASQFTGEMFVMRNAPELRDLPCDKLMVDFHLKGWTAKSQFPSPVQRGTVSRTAEQLERFRIKVVGVLQEIQETVEAYNAGLKLGTSPTELLDALFPETGEHTGECYAFASECEYIGPCRMGFTPGSLGGFRPARSPGEPEAALDTPTDEVS